MWIKLSKLFYVLLILYFGWFQIVFFQVPNLLFILGVGVVGFILLHALQHKQSLLKSVTLELFCWILFALTSLIFGLLMASSIDYLTSAITTFIQFLIIIFSIVYISQQDKNVDFFIKSFIVLSVVCALTTLFWGVEYSNGRISMGMKNNPNALGITMAIGLCCVLYMHSFKKLLYSVISLSLGLLFVYITLLTGSRKSFISILLILLYWFSFVALKDIGSLSFRNKLKGIISVTFIIYMGSLAIYPYLTDSIIIERLNSLIDSGDATREGMYDTALELFKQNKVVGIGFNNFRAVTIYETYSHSTYAETLAGTGILGMIFYFIPYLIMLGRYPKIAFSTKVDYKVRKQGRIMFGLFGVLIILGVGIIHYYELTSSIAFGMIFAFYNVNKKEKIPEV